MLKKILLDMILQAIVIALFMIAGVYLLGNNPLWNPFGKGDNENVRTVDTPEYKKLDSLLRAEREYRIYLDLRDSLRLEQINDMKELLKNRQIKYKNEINRIDNNTANTDFDELRGIIRSRRH